MITAANYSAFITTVDTTIGAIFSSMSAGTTRKQWTREVSMSGSQYTAGWTGRMPKARPWFGSRVVHQPQAQTYSVTPIPYELTYAIDAFILADSDVNTQSIFWRMLPDLARQWVLQPEYELRDLLEATGIQGTTPRQAGLDGLTAFNTAHQINYYNPGAAVGTYFFSGGTYCNDFSNGGQTLSGTLVGGALSQGAFSSILQYAGMVPGEDGEALGVEITDMMVPTTLQVESAFILKATFMAPQTWGAFGNLGTQVGTADNMLSKMGVRQIVNKYLRNPKRWYMMDTESGKPLLWVTREAPRTVPRTADTDPLVFDKHQLTYGGWDRVTPAWDYSWLIYRSAPAGY